MGNNFLKKTPVKSQSCHMHFDFYETKKKTIPVWEQELGKAFVNTRQSIFLIGTSF